MENLVVFLNYYSYGKKKKFDELVKRYRGYEEVLICDSMPSIEIWFLLHFAFTTQEFTCYKDIERILKEKLPDYEKTKIYLMQERWFRDLIANGGLAKAMLYSKRLMMQYSEEDVGQYFPFTKMHLAIDEFEKRKSVPLGLPSRTFVQFMVSQLNLIFLAASIIL